jgi:single-strand selective monofunctional uracil DNA glycosylase
LGLHTITKKLIDDLRRLRFGPPVATVYNPLEYAATPYAEYLKRYGGRPKEVLLIGMNPGPWGMAQTGVPFGEVQLVKKWLGIEAPVATPRYVHPKRPVQGFACTRSEVSGKRLWGWAKKTFATPERFFRRFFVANYCPLIFFAENGRNITPNTLPAADRNPLQAVCDEALQRTVQWLQPRYVIGVGRFATDRAEKALDGGDVSIGCITHPSPANPRANRGWEPLVLQELQALGIRL